MKSEAKSPSLGDHICGPLQDRLVRKQSNFLRTLQAQSGYNKFIERLRWTVMPRPGRLNRDTDPPITSQTYSRLLWMVLGHLRNLKHLDIADASSTHTIAPRWRVTPTAPSMTSLAICGALHVNFVHSLLRPVDLNRLTSLTLKDYVPRREALDCLHKFVKEQSLTVPPLNGMAWFTWHKAALSAKILDTKTKSTPSLSVLAQNCRSLQHLTITTTGRRCKNEVWMWLTFTLYHGLICAELMKASRASLQTIVLESFSSKDMNVRLPVWRPLMGLDFVKLVQETFAGVTWPKLRKLEMRGLKFSGVNAIKEMVGPNVEVLIDDLTAK